MQRCFGIEAGQRSDLGDEVARGADADGYMVFVAGWPNVRVSQAGGQCGDLRVEHHVEVGIGQAREVVGAGAQRRDDVHIDADLRRAGCVISRHVVAVAEAERGGAEQVAARTLALSRVGRRRAGRGRLCMRAGQRAHHL